MSSYNEKIGSVRIATDVVPLIAALAAGEVEGVVRIQDKKATNKVNIKKMTRGIKSDIQGKKVRIDMSVGILYGYQVPEVSSAIQSAVKTSIETMTGLEVSNVNVRIASVNMA